MISLKKYFFNCAGKRPCDEKVFQFMSYKSFPNTPRPTLIMDLQWQERFPSIKCQQTRTVTFVWVYIFLLEAASSDKHFMYSFRFVPFTTASASSTAALWGFGNQERQPDRCLPWDWACRMPFFRTYVFNSVLRFCVCLRYVAFCFNETKKRTNNIMYKALPR